METILIVSDSHHDIELLDEITKKYSSLKYKIHCGDSDIEYTHPSIASYINVRGNHDQDERFPIYQIVEICNLRILVTHGHYQDIWHGYDQIIQLAKENGCKIVLHGHTHIAHIENIDGIFCLNPGSLMFNRGNYGYGTYALMHIYDDLSYDYHFYHHTDYNEVTDIVLEDGKALLKELQKYL